jgi:hypothetical protein
MGSDKIILSACSTGPIPMLTETAQRSTGLLLYRAHWFEVSSRRDGNRHALSACR